MKTSPSPARTRDLSRKGRGALPPDPQPSTGEGRGEGGLRLLVISSDTYPPTRVDVTVLFARELTKRGHRVDWILQSEHACERSYVAEWQDCKVWVGATDLGDSLFHRVRKHVRGIVHDFKLIGIARRSDYDIVEVKDKFISGLFALAVKGLYGKRFIYWLSFPFPEEYLIRATDGTARYPFLYRIRGHVFRILLYKVLLRGADHVFVQSEQMRINVARHGIPLEHMTAVPMGVSAQQAGAISPSERTRIPRGERCFLYLGALDKVRRLELLIRALAKVRERLPAVKLYVIGRSHDPRDEQALKEEARRLGVDTAAVFVGQLPQAQALEYVREADVCVSPIYPTPIFEVASPTKLVEYMAMGKPVVANDHPEQRRLIEESGAGFCVPWEGQAFADAIVSLLEDPENAKARGQLGRQYVLAHRTYDVIAHVVEAKLREVAGASRVPA